MNPIAKKFVSLSLLFAYTLVPQLVYSRCRPHAAARGFCGMTIILPCWSDAPWTGRNPRCPFSRFCRAA